MTSRIPIPTGQPYSLILVAPIRGETAYSSAKSRRPRAIDRFEACDTRGGAKPRLSRRRGRALLDGAAREGLRNFYRTDDIVFTFVSDEYNGITEDNAGV